MMFENYKIGDILDHLIDNRGKTPPLVNEGIPLIQSFMLGKNNRYPALSENTKYVSKETFNSWFRSGHPVKGDLLIAVNGSIGEVSTVDKRKYCVAQDIVGLRFKKDICDSTYMYYLMSSPFMKEVYLKLNNGATRPSIRVPHLLAYEIPIIDDLNKQKSIANILSSLDDKIELNNKINKNLEEMAQTLYKRWFVDFEFPNENGEPYKSGGGDMVESELGLIPKGWEVEKLGVGRLSKLIPSGISAFVGSKKYIATADVADTKISSFKTAITFDERPSRANMQPVKNSLWFAKMKDSRKLIRVSQTSKFLIEKCIFSTGFAGLLVEQESFHYIWTYMTTPEFNDKKNNLCNGTTMQSINNDNITRINIVAPPKDILIQFEAIAGSLFEKIQVNDIENSKLASIRDELLPKLMSGEIEVSLKENLYGN